MTRIKYRYGSNHPCKICCMPFIESHFAKHSADKFRRICISCFNWVTRQRYHQQKLIKEPHKVAIEYKHCRKCNITRHYSNFHKEYKNVDGLQSYCIDCHRKYVRRALNKKRKNE